MMNAACLSPLAIPTTPKLIVSILSLKIALAYLMRGKGCESELACREQLNTFTVLLYLFAMYQI